MTQFIYFITMNFKETLQLKTDKAYNIVIKK